MMRDAPRSSRIFIYYIHTEKYSLKSCVVNFDTQMSSSQSEGWTMVFTREKKWYVQSESRTMFFHMWEKWCVQSEATEVCEFRAKIPAFSCSLLIAASHIFEEKSFSQRVFFFSKKRKTFQKWSGIVSFVSLLIKKIVESRRNNSGRGKTEQDVNLCCAFCRSYFVFHL